MEHPNFASVLLERSRRRECLLVLASSTSSKPNTPLCTKIILLD